MVADSAASLLPSSASAFTEASGRIEIAAARLQHLLTSSPRIEMSPSRTLRSVVLALLLGAVVTAGAAQGDTHVDDMQASLIALSASDFAANGPRPDGFRSVVLRYREDERGARVYMLCGQFRTGAGAAPEWVDFATVRTDPYEQWIGGSAADMCARATPVPADGSDLSSAIRSAVEDKLPASGTQ